MIDKKNYSLLAHNTFGIDVRCRRFVEYGSVEEAQELVRALTPEDGPLLILGGGSNLLLTGDYEGTVIHSAIRFIEPLGEGRVRCGSGQEWDAFVAWCVANGYHGAENLSLIPGECGASAVQNIGAYGAEACDLIEEVEAVEIATGRLWHLKGSDCGYSYRQSRFKHEWRDRFLITSVTYRLSTQFDPQLDYGNIRAALAEKAITHPTAEQMRQTIIEIRRSKLPDPKVFGNAGSFFMNPIVGEEKFRKLQAQYPQIPHYEMADADGTTRYKVPAGWLIDQCGWKGRSLGRAGVYARQALVLINLGGATGQEVKKLCEAVRHDVSERFGIEINPEVNIR